ncbi:hypothetical protein CHARACLAT_028944 [Characodon lateralis]|uniref:Uncharacterized protein n=1 Tax=Characodon lateralis TaxID=208331 RepID=A0ABU7DKT8_9TELE|nr:hypothetical protein [Characodon lateralis]
MKLLVRQRNFSSVQPSCSAAGNSHSEGFSATPHLTSTGITNDTIQAETPPSESFGLPNTTNGSSSPGKMKANEILHTRSRLL